MNFLSAHPWVLASPLMMMIGLPAGGTAATNLQAA